MKLKIFHLIELKTIINFYLIVELIIEVKLLGIGLISPAERVKQEGS